MSRKIATLWDQNKAKDANDHHNNDHDRQQFYVGGSEHSGQQVLGNPSGEPGSGNNENVVGNRLGGNTSGGNAVGGSALGGSGANPRNRRFIDDFFAQPFPHTAPEESSAESTLPITFWRNGFSIGDDNELHEYNTPENREFLGALRRGETPPQLAGRVRDGMIDVKLENKSHEDFKPKSTFKAFSGEGRRLGAPTP